MRVFGRHLGAYTQPGGDLPTQFATESMFCDELSGTSYGSWRFSNPATSPAVCLLAGYFALAAEPGDLFPHISEENVLREREKLRAGQRKSR